MQIVPIFSCGVIKNNNVMICSFNFTSLLRSNHSTKVVIKDPHFFFFHKLHKLHKLSCPDIMISFYHIKMIMQCTRMFANLWKPEKSQRRFSWKNFSWNSNASIRISFSTSMQKNVIFFDDVCILPERLRTKDKIR